MLMAHTTTASPEPERPRPPPPSGPRPVPTAPAAPAARAVESEPHCAVGDYESMRMGAGEEQDESAAAKLLESLEVVRGGMSPKLCVRARQAAGCETPSLMKHQIWQFLSVLWF